MRRTAVLPALLLSTAALGALPASPAGGAARRAPQLTAAPTAVQPGGTLTLRGRGFPGGVHLALLAGPPNGRAVRVGGAVTGRGGRFSATLHIRPRSAGGAFVARACRDGCRIAASASFRIVAP